MMPAYTTHAPPGQDTTTPPQHQEKKEQVRVAPPPSFPEPPHVGRAPPVTPKNDSSSSSCRISSRLRTYPHVGVPPRRPVLAPEHKVPGSRAAGVRMRSCRAGGAGGGGADKSSTQLSNTSTLRFPEKRCEQEKARQHHWSGRHERGSTGGKAENIGFRVGGSGVRAAEKELSARLPDFDVDALGLPPHVIKSSPTTVV